MAEKSFDMGIEPDGSHATTMRNLPVWERKLVISYGNIERVLTIEAKTKTKLLRHISSYQLKNIME